MSHSSLWTPEDVGALRGRLRLSRAQFARLVGVDQRTVIRWESDNGPRPKGASEAVLSAIRERLDADPGEADGIIKFLVGTAAVGGLAYLLVKLLGSVTTNKEES